MSQDQRGADLGKNSSDHDLSTALMILIGGFFVYILLVIAIKYLALMSTYLYYPFTMPVYAFAGNRYVAFLIVAIYSAIAFGLAFLSKIKKAKMNWISFSYGVFWLLVAFGEMIFFKKTPDGSISTPLTAHVNAFCNPSDTGALYILSCQNTVKEVGENPIIMIIFIAMIPNMVYGLNSIFTIFKNFSNLAKHPKSIAKKRIPDVNALIDLVAPHQPHLMIYKSIDPNQINWNSGQLRLMDTPRRFCFENDLIDGFVRRPNKYNPDSYKDQTGMKNTDKEQTFQPEGSFDLVPTINVNKFEEVMSSGLGDVFTGVDELSACQTIVLGLAMSLTCRGDLHMDQKQAKAILKETQSHCDDIFKWAAKDIQTKHKIHIGMQRYPKLQDYKDMITRWDDHPIAKSVYANHAYTNTIILRCLTDAKKLGVFQPSSLRWLMFYDRPLFAIVQNESRPSVFAENAATSSHFEFERKLGRKIITPMFSVAYNGFMDNLREYRYPDHQVEAWELYKRTGDASKMIEYKMVSEAFSYEK